MKKILYYIFFISLLFIPIVKVKAFTRLRTANQSPIVGSEITLNLELDYGADAEIASAYYEISYDDTKFSYSGIIWSQTDEQIDTSTSGLIKIRKTDSGKNWYIGDVAIIKMDVIGSGKTTIYVNAPERAYYDSGNVVGQTLSNITFSIKEPDTQTKVGSIFVKGYQMSPAFSADTFEYSLVVPSDVESVEVVAKPKNKKQTITGDGIRKLVYGYNLVRITVTAENGESLTYRVMIQREDDRSSDTSLSMLEVSNTEIKYEEGKYEYEAEVSKSVDKITITAKGKDPKAIITGMGEKKLNLGKNTFEIELKSSSGNTQKYKFVITRSSIEFQSSNIGTKLKNLTINGKEYDSLNHNIFNIYNLTGMSSLDIVAEPRSISAKTTITGNNDLKEGPNTIKITVRESSGATEDYFIYVYNFLNPAREIKSFDISFDPIREDRFTLIDKEQEAKIPEGLVSSIKKNDYVLSVGIKDEQSLPYIIKLDKTVEQGEKILTAKRVDNKALPTFNLQVPKGIEVSIYVGELFPDQSIVRIYSYQDDENVIKEVSPGVQIMGGYITFKTNEQSNYIFTIEQLIKVDRTIQDYIEQYKEYIAYGIGGLLVVMVVVKFLQYIKIRSKRKL